MLHICGIFFMHSTRLPCSESFTSPNRAWALGV